MAAVFRRKMILILTCLPVSFLALAAERPALPRKVALTVALSDPAKGDTFGGRGDFVVSFDGAPSNNLQSIGRTSAATVLAEVEPLAHSADVYVVKVGILDRATDKIVQSATMQVGFASARAKESDASSLTVNTKLFFKSHTTAKVQLDEGTVKLAVRLKRE